MRFGNIILWIIFALFVAGTFPLLAIIWVAGYCILNEFMISWLAGILASILPAILMFDIIYTIFLEE